MSNDWPHRAGCRICVSLAEPTVARLLEGFADIDGADLVEVRLDALDVTELRPEILERLVAAAPAPVGFTLRPHWHGGDFQGPEENRRALLARAASLDVAFVDVELEASWAAEFVANAAGPVVLSHHWYEAGAADLDERVGEALQIAPAVVKLVGTAAAPDDAVPFLRAAARMAAVGQASSCFCMGEAGRASRLLGAARGAALIYAAIDADAPVAPGQWTLRRLRDEFGVQSWSSESEIYGLVGDPIDHSLSPALFNAVFRERNESRVYIPLAGSDLDAVLRLAGAAGVLGASVTMPFKAAMADRAAVREPLVERTGAANTIVFRESGWMAFNTDGGAVVEALAAVMSREVGEGSGPEVSSAGGVISGARIAIIGAGGAARAAAAALVAAGAEVTILNRTASRAEDAARVAGCASAPLDTLGEGSFDAIVNATPVGMHGGGLEDDTPFAVSLLSGSEIVFDMVYRPRMTPLLAQAAQRGCKTVEGLEMFVRQAAVQYRHLTGDPADGPLAVIRGTVERFVDHNGSV